MTGDECSRLASAGVAAHLHQLGNAIPGGCQHPAVRVSGVVTGHILQYAEQPAEPLLLG